MKVLLIQTTEASVLGGMEVGWDNIKGVGVRWDNIRGAEVR